MSDLYTEYRIDGATLGSLESQYNQYLRRHKKASNKGAFGKDSERGKVYKAEWAFQKKIGEANKDIATVQEAQRYANKVTSSQTFAKICTKRRGDGIKLRAKQSRNGWGYAGMAYHSEIVLDVNTGMNTYTVLHELAHTAGHRHHGRSFRQALLKLVSRFMGPDIAAVLKAEFKAAKLTCGEARKPQTFEQWVAAKERMEKTRGAFSG